MDQLMTKAAGVVWSGACRRHGILRYGFCMIQQPALDV